MDGRKRKEKRSQKIEQSKSRKSGKSVTRKIDSSNLDTIVVPAKEDGFKKEFLGKNCWYAIRIHSSMIKQIKYIAAYQVAPISAITHIAKIKSIKPYLDTKKYMIEFIAPAEKIKPIKLVPFYVHS